MRTVAGLRRPDAREQPLRRLRPRRAARHRSASSAPPGSSRSAPARTTGAARRPALVEAGGIRVAFLGYSDVNPLGFPAESASPGTARAELSSIDADVRAARRRADVVVCFFHWGTELHAAPEARQQQFAAACLAAGAQVVLGAHPHVFGSVIRPGPRTLVAWTLGNFVFPSSGLHRPHGDPAGAHSTRAASAATASLPVQIDGFRPRRRLRPPLSRLIHRLHKALWKC